MSEAREKRFAAVLNAALDEDRGALIIAIDALSMQERELMLEAAQMIDAEVQDWLE